MPPRPVPTIVSRIALCAVALLLAAAPPPSVAGDYEVNQMEMGGGLRLQSDGRFLYALEYGAVSERSEGFWTLESGFLRLTTAPMPPKTECDRGFGTACFNRTRLAPEEGNWVLDRWDARVVFHPLPR